MTQTAPLIEYLDRQMALVDGIVEACAARKARRINTLSARALKGAETRRANAALQRVTAPLGLRPEPVPVSAIRRVSAFADDWDRCPACNFILVACDCDDQLTQRREK